MNKCRWCGREGSWPEICLSTRDMEEKQGDSVCDDALMKAGGGEYSSNRARASQQEST
jgi:hypothetical protein